jgi:hypothetical protein
VYFTNHTLGITKDFLYYSIIKDGKKEIIKKPNTLTLHKIRKQFGQTDFDNFYTNTGGRHYKNSILENRKIPPFSFLYYYLLIKNEKIPTPQEMVNKYIKFFCEKDENGYHIKSKYAESELFYFNYKAIAGRVCRAYNSFNREVDLLFQLFKDNEIQAKYDFKIDILQGMDIVVKFNGEKKGIACYQETKRANDFYTLKHTTRRQDGDNIIIPLAMNRYNSIHIGDIRVFSKRTYDKLIKEIKGEDKNE